MKLSRRLGYLQQYFKNESIIWDIGCDHALLGLSFVDTSWVEEIHLVDPSLAVVEKLQQKLKDSYITNRFQNIFSHHMEGQKIILSSKKNLIYIAGMGGKEIKEIIECLLPQMKEGDRLVISPHRKILELREYLHETKLHLEDEKVFQEEGQFYQILSLSLDTARPKVSLYGDELWKSQEGEEYRLHQMKFFGLHKDMASQRYHSFLKSLSP